MTAHGYTLFDTPVGLCGMTWSDRGITGVLLPEPSAEELRARLLELYPDAHETPPPDHVRDALDAIHDLLGGGPGDLSGITLDMDDVTPFRRRVYEVAREIEPGSMLSYGDIAARLGKPTAARAVGQALGRNPFAIVVPCHRVVSAGGGLGGFSATGGVDKKAELLTIERPSADYDDALGFDRDIAVKTLRAADPVLARLIDTVGPFDLGLKTSPSTFGALAEAIVYQQLHTKAAETIFRRLCALFSGDGLTAEDILAASDQELRGAGLSRAKLAAMRDLAQKVTDGEVPSLAEIRRMDDDAVVESLTRVRGVGRWTAEMLLIFRLGRPDVLPTDDFGIRHGFALTFASGAKPTKRDVERHGERWRPYRTVASWYLWEAVSLAKEGNR